MDETFAVTYSTPSSKALTKFVRDNYDVGLVVDCRFLSRGLNDAFLILTQGSIQGGSIQGVITYLSTMPSKGRINPGGHYLPFNHALKVKPEDGDDLVADLTSPRLDRL